MILVFGATGTVGRQLVVQLVDAGQSVRAISRHPDTAGLPDPVEARFADLGRPDTLPPVLDDVDAAFLLQGDYPVDEVVAALASSGVSRVVFMSALAVSTRPDSSLAQRHVQTEEALIATGLNVTVLRPGQFASNTVRWRDMIDQGTVYLHHPDVAVPTIDPYDIAAVAATILTDPDRQTDGRYELTGPSVSARRQVGTLAGLLDRSVRVVELSTAQAEAQIRASVPPQLVDAMVELLGEPSAVERRELPTVAQLLGRPPRDFSTWAAKNLSAFTAQRDV